MKKMLIAILATLTMTSAVYASTFTVVPAQSKTPVSVSFLQVSNVAVLKPVDAKNGVYELVIKKVSDNVAYFSDRPNRIVGQMTMKAYLAKWNEGSDSLNKDAPNGVLSGVNIISSHQRAPINVVMELSKPEYSATKDTFTYQAHILKMADGSQLGKEVTVHKATLLVDNACLSCT